MNKKRSKTVRALLLAVLAVLLLSVVPINGSADERRPVCFRVPIVGKQESCIYPPGS